MASIMLPTSTMPLPAMSNARITGSTGDVDTGLDAQDLHGAVPLVVVHRDDQVEVAAAGQEERGVGRERAAGVDAVGLQLFDGLGDLSASSP